MTKAKLVSPRAGPAKAESAAKRIADGESWWDFCPICNSRLVNHKCRFVCSNPCCSFFMSCSEFDL